VVSGHEVKTHVLDWDRSQPFSMGRHVEHHEKSKQFPAPVAEKIVTKLWTTSGPVLNQGKIGACTGNAMADLANTDYWTPTRTKIHPAGYLAEADALKFYGQATHLDKLPGGYYPPNDRGSTGIAVAKAAKADGYAASYAHAFGLEHMLGALQLRPVICGTAWTQDMFAPDSQGFIAPTGQVAGGHEYLCLGCDVENEFLTFLNSWSATWGLGGRFKIKFQDYDELLSANGDVVVPVPVVVPSPVAA
jgi:hypothetical protein